jgi:hypothetical protein
MNRSALLLAVVLAGGCGKEAIKSYTVAKEKAAPMTQPDLPAGHPDMTAAPPPLRWTTPDGWKEGAPSEFRVASFRVTGPGQKEADVSVIPLPGGAGGDFSNVNRWRSQVGLEPVSEEELKKLTETVELAGQPAKLYDQGGESLRILAAVQHRGGMAWFFKMTGDSEFVAQEKPIFVEFLRSVRFVTGETAVAPPSAGTPQWEAPADWKEASAGQFLVAKYTIAGADNAEAAVNISSSAGDGGGLAANVNRWRKQLGLSELTGDELAKSLTPVSDQVTLVEMKGTDARSGQPASLVGAIVLQPEQAWFYKLMGDAAVVAAQKDAFTKFVQEVKY